MRWRRVRLTALVVLLVLLAAWVGMDLWAGRRVDAEAARFEKQYGSMTKGALRSPARIPAADNRARVARAAAALTVLEAGSNDYRPVGRFLAGKALSPVPAEVRGFVEAHRPAIRVAEETRARARSSWEADYDSGVNIPGFMDLRTLSNAIYLSALIDLEEGRADSAAHAVGTGLAVASTLRQEPALIAQLIRIAVATIPLQAVQQIVARSEPSAGALEDLARWLAENRSPSPIGVGLLGEAGLGHAAWSKLEKGRVEEFSGGTILGPAWVIGPLARLNRPLVRLAHLRHLQAAGRLLEIETGPRPRSAFASARPTPLLLPGLSRVYAMFTAGLERSVESGDEFNGQLSAAELAVALRRFRLDRGSYPDDLSALVPEYLASVPIDPFTGRAPVYARKGAGFELHGEWPKDRGSRPRPAVLDWVVTK